MVFLALYLICFTKFVKNQNKVMKKIYLLSSLLLFISNLSIAQTAEFKKAIDNGNQKFKIKSYSLAIMDYEAAIKIVAPEVDKLIAAKTPIPADKKYMIEPYEKRAVCSYYTKNITVMRADLEKIFILDSSNVNAKGLKAFDKFQTGKKTEGCIGMKNEAIKGSEVAAQAHKDCFCNNEAIVLAKEAITSNNMKKYDDALIKLEQALKILPDSGYIHGEKGKSLMGKGDYNGALKSLNNAVSLSKKDYKSYYSRALAYQKLNQPDSAMNDLNECLKLKPTFYEAYLLRADIAEQKEMWNSVIFDLKNCIKLKPTDGKLDYRIAVILDTKDEDLIDACTYYKSAFEKGYEEASEMATNCGNLKYMKTHEKNSKKEKMPTK